MNEAPPSRDEPVRDALDQCARITRQRARNFYYGLKLLPRPKRDAMYAVYAWMRRVDDCVDGPVEGNPNPTIERRRAALDRLVKLTDRAFAGDSTENLNLFTALRWVIERFQISQEPFRAMINGQRTDLDGGRFETTDQLLQYCEQVGSSVGQISIDVWSHRHDDAPSLAHDRGIAFQLTNIIRDFAEDHDNGRAYLPAEEFARFNITPDDLRRWRKPRECEAMMRFQVERARSFYDRADGLDEMISQDCRATSLAMVNTYRRLLDKIELNHRKAATGQRISLSRLAKMQIVMGARRAARRGATAQPELCAAGTDGK